MCRAVTCRACGRPGWKGCGAHVEEVLGHVPAAERCQCTPSTSGTSRRGGWSRLFGRSSSAAPGQEVER